jgi:hypothetical protein
MRRVSSITSVVDEKFRRSVLGCVLAALLAILVLTPTAGAAAAGVNVTAGEGQSFTGTVVNGLVCPLLSATISWGDGTSSAGSSDGSMGIKGTHTYADEGTFSGSVSFTYTTGGAFSCPTPTQMATFQATVVDAPLTAAGLDVSGTAGQPAGGVVAHFSDANPGAGAGDFSAQVSWGDGSASTSGTITASPTGGFDVSGTHIYGTAGGFPVSVSLTDIGGSAATADSNAQITTPPNPSGPPNSSGPPVARLTVTPNPTCTGVQTKFDASASSAPGGIVSYRFEYTQQSDDPKFGDVLVSAGPDSAAYTYFQFDKLLAFGLGGGPEGLRFPADVKVTVSDSRGATATATVHVTFVQKDSVTDTRTGCPPGYFSGLTKSPYRFPFGNRGSLPKLKVGSDGITTILPCRGRVICLGSLSIAAIQARVGRVAAKRRPPPPIAVTTFQIAAGKRQRVHARFTSTGRRLLRSGKAAHAQVVITALAPNGNTLRRSETITLRLHRHRHR